MGEALPDEEIDKPVAGPHLGRIGQLPILVFGAGVFSNQYNADSHLESDTPVRSIRLALRYGINAFDTSVYYGPSEVVLGNALRLIQDEFPRESYQLMTKCGRYGVANFDYSPATIRNSVLRSLERLQTSYLDTVYLHDVEFVATAVLPRNTGNHSSALTDEQESYGLEPGSEGKIRGDGDVQVLAAFGELQKLKAEGKIKNIGITGFPLPTLLRLALLILHNAPFKPIDAILSYSHLCLQNATMASFVPAFRERANVKTLLGASPFSMGLLAPTTPDWHPAPPALRAAVTAARSHCKQRTLTQLSLHYSMRLASQLDLPLVVGLSSPREVHECIEAWRGLPEDGVKEEDGVRELFKECGYLDWSWASP